MSAVSIRMAEPRSRDLDAFARYLVAHASEPEPGAIGIGRVRTDSHAMADRQLHRSAHDVNVARMGATGNIRTTDKRKDRRVRVHPFPHVAIEVHRKRGIRRRIQHTISFK